jgi:hypothetical protein
LGDSIVVDKLLDSTFTDFIFEDLDETLDEIKQIDFDWIQDSIEDIALTLGSKTYKVVNETVEVGAYNCWGDNTA